MAEKMEENRKEWALEREDKDSVTLSNITLPIMGM